MNRLANSPPFHMQILHELCFTAYSSPLILCQGDIALFPCHPAVCATFILSYARQVQFIRKKLPGVTPLRPQLPHGPTHASPPSLFSTCRNDFTANVLYRDTPYRTVAYAWANTYPLFLLCCYILVWLHYTKQFQGIRTVGPYLPSGITQSSPPSFIVTWRGVLFLYSNRVYSN